MALTKWLIAGNVPVCRPMKLNFVTVAAFRLIAVVVLKVLAMTRYCSICELPQAICACAEAKAYDEANPLVEPHEHKFEYTGQHIGMCVIMRCACGEEVESDVS